MKILHSLSLLAATIAAAAPELRERVSEATFLKFQSALNQVEADAAANGASLDNLAEVTARLAGGGVRLSDLPGHEPTPEELAADAEREAKYAARHKAMEDLQDAFFAEAPALIAVFKAEMLSKSKDQAAAAAVQERIAVALEGLLNFLDTRAITTTPAK